VPELRDATIAGATITGVESIGKNLLIRFDDGRALHSHMRMNGVWRIQPKNKPIRASSNDVRARIEVDDVIAFCLRAPVMRLLKDADRDHDLKTIGPDLLAPDFDHEEARKRLRALADLPIATALMTQNAVAGIGNVYKSEALFVARKNPLARVAAFSDAELDEILNHARRLMRPNTIRNSMRTTRSRNDGPRHWVYMRAGERCMVCGERIVMDRSAGGRSTYFCPDCQREPHA
jgi:endonuclease-8